MELSCLFVNYNSWQLVAAALQSLREHPPLGADGQPIALEAIVVDNASPRTDPGARTAVADALARIGGRLICHGENGGYAKGMNLAYAHCRGRLVLVCNPDLLFAAGALTALVAWFDAHPGVGAVAPAVYADRTLQVQMPIHILPGPMDLLRTTLGMLSIAWNRRYSAARTGAALRVWGEAGPVEEPMFGGCCFLTSRAVIDAIGFFDDGYPLYFEDTDLALRMRRAGLGIVRLGSARIVHLYDRSAATNRAEAMARLRTSRRRFFARWHGVSGRLVLALSSWLLASRWGRARARRIAAQPVQDMAWEGNRPVLLLPRRCERFLVEIAYEPFLFLAAGTFGSGDRWEPGDGVLAELRQEAWLRAVDLTGPAPVELGRWHYRARQEVASP